MGIIISEKPTKPSPFSWYKKVVFDNYFNFRGRASRRELWWFTLFHLLASGTTLVIAAMFFDDTDNLEWYYIPCLYFIATFIPVIAVQVRRVHDIGYSGWILLIPIIMVPYSVAIAGVIAAVILLIMYSYPSEPEENKYVAPPE